MKKFLTILLMLLILIVTYNYKEEINTFYLTHFSTINKDVDLKNKNEYFRNFSYNYLQNVDSFIVTSKSELNNIYYTIINSGVDKFTFYCSSNYKSCIDDVVEIANNQITLSNINSFVHPYNSFSSIETKYDTLGKITLKINKAYTNDQISKLNDKIEQIISSQNIKKTDDNKEIIKKIHDYIINNSKYDSDKSDKNINRYHSNIAYGPLIEGYGLCGGYTDSMAIFLDYFNIPNFKVISENHIWNAVYLDNEWYNLDLTWDDPVTSNNTDILEYNFFLIKTKDLEKLETNQHIFDKNVFSELR